MGESEELARLRRENAQLKKRQGAGDGARCPQTLHDLVGEVAEADLAVLVWVISDQKTVHDISHRTSCRALGVSEAWFYKWRRRPDEPTKREINR
ncbi:hypothetical protein [Streptomyces sp. NPDC055105]|uniref:hypothetical protein n=1 Tax=Streptomyces sp. NPDC055105 TaxID=3365719 RepID=UPI0037D3A9ED